MVAMLCLKWTVHLPQEAQTDMASRAFLLGFGWLGQPDGIPSEERTFYPNARLISWFFGQEAEVDILFDVVEVHC